MNYKPFEIICGTCLKPITKWRTGQKFHAGDCAKAAHNKRCIERSRKKWLEVSPLINRVCPICKDPYQTRERRPAMTCSKPTCKNAVQRRRMKMKYEKLPVEERKKIMKANYAKYGNLYRQRSIENVHKAESQTLACKCPGCRTIHEHTFEPAWIGGAGMPWIKCKNYPSCLENNKDGIYAVTADMTWEMGNSARV